MYSIKTDLDVTGGATVNKDLLVKGNAVFEKNVTVNGTVSFANATFTAIEAATANITSTLDVAGKASLNGGVDIKGNSVIGDAVVGSDTATVNSNASFNGTASFANDINQTAGSAVLKNTTVDQLEVTGTTQFDGNITAGVGTTAAFDKLTANEATITAISSETITGTGTANFKDVNISGTLGGTFSLDDINATTLNVSGASGLQGAVTFGANVTGINSTATFKDIKLGANSASSTYRLSFTYSASGQRPTVVLQNEIQSELMSPTNLNVLKTATFGDESLDTYGITGKGLNKLDYVSISGNTVQSPTTPLLEVTKGLTKVTDFEVTGSATIPNIESTGTANFNDININGVLGGTFSLDDINATSLNVSGASGLNGAVTLGANITGINTTATFKDIKLGANAASSTDRLSFTYSAAGLRPTVVLQNEIQTELMSPTNLNVLKSATFGDESLSTYSIASKGLNKLDYVTISGNLTQDPSTPLLEVTKGLTKVTDLEVTGTATLPNIESTGTANFNNINVSGTLGGTFDLDDIQATSLNVSGATGLNGAVTLGANITGNNTTATVKAITLGQNVANADVKLGFGYSAAGQRPTVLLQNEIQSESMAPVTLTVQKTATFGDESLATYGITGKGLNKLDYVEILGNSTQSPATPRLKVNGKTILNDVDFTGVVTGLTVDVSGQDLTPNSVIAAGEIKSSSLESTGGATINANLLVGGTANVTGALNSGAITSTGNVKGVGGEFSGNVSGVDGTFTGNVSGVNGTFSGDVSGAAGAFSGNVTVTGQTVTVKDLVVTGTTTGVVADANVDGLDIAPNKVDVTTTLSVAGASTLADVSAGAITATGNVSAAAISGSSNAAVGGTLGVTGAATLNGGLTSSALTVTGDSVVQKLTVKGEFIPEGGLDLSGADITANSLDVATTLKATGLSTLSGGVSTTDISGSGKITTVDAQTGTLTVTGNQTVGGTLGVTGKATTGSLDTGAVSATSGTFSSTLGVTGAATFTDAVTVNGVFTPVGGLDLSTSDITANSLDVATTIKSTAGATIGGNSTIAGTLGVTGDVTAPTLTLSNASGTGLDVKGNAIVAGTLSTTGAVTLGNTLGVTGKATTGSLDTGAVSATSIVGTAGLTMAGNSSFTNDLTVSGTFTPAGGLDLTTSDIVAKSLSTSAAIHSDTNGTFGGTLDVTSNATVGGTLGVTGAVSAPSLALSSASGDALTVAADAKVTGKVTSGSLETGTVKTGANLVVGVKVGEQPETVQIFPDTFIAGKLRVEGGINADIDVSGQTLEPYAIEASATLSAVGNISTDAAVIANSGTFGAVGSQNNNLTVNGNVVTTGNFTVGGVLYANVDQSNADVNVKSLTSTNLVKGGSMQSTGNLTVGGAATITGTLGSGAITSTGKVKGVDGEFSGNVSGVGGTFTGAVTVGTTLGVTGAATVGGTLGVTGKATLAEASVTNLTTSGTATIGSTLAVTGTSTLAAVNISGALTTTGSVTLGDAAADVITVNGTSTFIEKATFEKGIEVAGVFTTDEANFVTTSVTTKKYDVIPSQVTSSTVAPAGTWTPDGSTSVYFITLDQNTTLAPIAGLIGGGKAASIFMYAKQDATGNRVLTADPSYSIVDGEQNLAANSVTIYQAVYDGVSNVIDLFIAQRTS